MSLVDLPTGDPSGIAIGLITGFLGLSAGFVWLWRRLERFYAENVAYHSARVDERDELLDEIQGEIATLRLACGDCERRSAECEARAAGQAAQIEFQAIQIQALQDQISQQRRDT